MAFFCDSLLVLCIFIVAKVCGSPPYNGDVRLVNDGTIHPLNRGRLEIYLEGDYGSDGVWGTVQYSTAVSQRGVAQAVCRQLGYYNYTREGTVVALGYPMASSDTPTHLRNVKCTYNSFAGDAIQHILECDYRLVPSGSMFVHSLDFAVECSNTLRDVFPYDTQIRLIQGDPDFASSGYVEIHLNNRWGPVCNMGSEEADTACKQLGYTGAADYERNKDGLVTSDDEQLDTFHCEDDHTCLRSCFMYPSPKDFIYCYGNSYIDCTFTFDGDTHTYGSQSLCTYIPVSAGMAVGLTMAALVLLSLCIAMVAGCLCCYCIPGCIFHDSTHRGRVMYDTINS